MVVREGRAFSANQLLGFVLGGAFGIAGVVGFGASKDEPFAGKHGFDVFGLTVNQLHSVAHLLIATILLAAATHSAAASRVANAAMGVLYLALGVAGLFILHTSLNVLGLNAADNGLHLGSGVVLLAVAGLGTSPRGDVRPEPPGRPRRGAGGELARRS